MSPPSDHLLFLRILAAEEGTKLLSRVIQLEIDLLNTSNNEGLSRMGRLIIDQREICVLLVLVGFNTVRLHPFWGLLS